MIILIPILSLICIQTISGLSIPEKTIIILNNELIIPYLPATFGIFTNNIIIGKIIYAEPLDGCSSIIPSINNNIVLIERGNCSFIEKAINAQDADYIAMIVYDNIPNENLIIMTGNDTLSIYIPSVFISLNNSYLISQNDTLIINNYSYQYNSYNTYIYVCLTIAGIGIILMIIIIISYFKRLYNFIQFNNRININNMNEINIDEMNNQPITNNIILDDFIINIDNVNINTDTDTDSIKSIQVKCIICHLSNDDMLYKFDIEKGGCDCINTIFHKECMSEWFTKNSSCPTCRKIYN